MQSPEKELCFPGKREKYMEVESTAVSKREFSCVSKREFSWRTQDGRCPMEVGLKKSMEAVCTSKLTKSYQLWLQEWGKWQSNKTWQEGGVPFKMRTPKCSSLSVCLHVNQISVPSNCQNRSDIHSQWSLKATYLILNRHLFSAVKLVGVEEMERQMTD